MKNNNKRQKKVVKLTEVSQDLIKMVSETTNNLNEGVFSVMENNYGVPDSVRNENSNKMIRISERITLSPEMLFTSENDPDLKNHLKRNRKINELKVIKIINDFDERVVKPVIVIQRGVKFLVLDGQHTLTALMALGYRLIPCMAIDPATTPEECVELIERYNEAGSNMTTRQKMMIAKGWVGEDMRDLIKKLRLSYEVTIIDKPSLLFKFFKEEENKNIFFTKVAAYKNHCRLEGSGGRRIYCGKQHGVLNFEEFYKNN